MSFELTMLAWTLVLALVQVLLPAVMGNRELGMGRSAGWCRCPASSPGA